MRFHILIASRLTCTIAGYLLKQITSLCCDGLWMHEVAHLVPILHVDFLLLSEVARVAVLMLLLWLV